MESPQRGLIINGATGIGKFPLRSRQEELIAGSIKIGGKAINNTIFAMASSNSLTPGSEKTLAEEESQN